MCLNSPELALAPGLSSWPAQVKAHPSRLQLVQHRHPCSAEFKTILSAVAGQIRGTTISSNVDS
jgi:hypothetical protein